MLQGDSVIARGWRGEALLLGEGGGQRGRAAAAAAADVQMSVQQVSGRRHRGHAQPQEMRLEQLAAASKGQLKGVLSLQLRQQNGVGGFAGSVRGGDAACRGCLGGLGTSCLE